MNTRWKKSASLFSGFLGVYGRMIMIGVCSLVLFAASAGQQTKLPPDYEKKREALSKFEVGVVPLLIVGDLNEDGEVNQEDLRLLRNYVAGGEAAGISCLAAADLDDNGSVNAKDITVLEQILGRGKVTAPALSAHARLGCDFKNFFVAARPQGNAGGNLPIHFLDPGSNPQNSTVAVASGPATVTATHNEFLVQIAHDAPSGSVVTVSITLASHRKYFYSFSIAPR